MAEPIAPRPHQDIEQDLARLGVRELEERLELTTLVGGDVVDTDACECSCRCDDTPEEELDLALRKVRINDSLLWP